MRTEVEASLRGAGIKIAKVAPDRMTIVAEGTAEQIEAYFQTKLADYEVGDETVRLASSALSAPTTVAPLISGTYSSRAAMSKESVVTASTTSCAFKPGSRAIDCKKFATARCGIITPLGWPVDPDV